MMIGITKFFGFLKALKKAPSLGSESLGDFVEGLIRSLESLSLLIVCLPIALNNHGDQILFKKTATFYLLSYLSL